MSLLSVLTMHHYQLCRRALGMGRQIVAFTGLTYTDFLLFKFFLENFTENIQNLSRYSNLHVTLHCSITNLKV